MEKIVEAGHEIGLHGYSHENPIAMTAEQEEAVLDKCIEVAKKYTGKQATGYVAPWWEFSPITNELLLKKGFKYDHSLMHDDVHPYYVRVGDSWTKIDYSKSAEEWMKPLVRGEETDLIEIPANWYLDDLPPMMFIKAAPNSHGFVSPRHLSEMYTVSPSSTISTTASCPSANGGCSEPAPAIKKGSISQRATASGRTNASASPCKRGASTSRHSTFPGPVQVSCRIALLLARRVSFDLDRTVTVHAA